MSDLSRYARYSQGRLPKEKRTQLLYGEKDDTGKYYRCWNCRAICDSEREILDTGEFGRSGVTVLSNTSLLLHMEGDNASTTFTDSSPLTTHTVTANGDAQLSTSQYKFGTASGLFDGTGDYLTIPDNADFDFSGGYWTVDFWIRGNWSGTGNEGIYFQRTDVNNYFSIYILKDAGGYGVNLSIYESGSEVVSLATGTPCIVNATWTHVEVSEYLNNYSIFVNGIKVSKLEDTSRPTNYTDTVYTGCTAAAGSATEFFKGNLDEFRVNKSTRHLDGFDVPTAAYDPDAYESGAYYPDVTGGCWFCGSTNYR